MTARPKGSSPGAIRLVYGTFARHLWTYKRWLGIAYAGLLGAIVMKLAAPWPLKLIFDYVLVDRPMPDALAPVANLFGGDAMALLAVCCIGSVLIVVLEVTFSYVSTYYMAASGHSITNDIRKRAFAHLQALPHSYHTKSRTGDLVVRLTGDITQLKKLLITFAEAFSKNVFSFIMIIGTMWLMEWKLTLLSLLVIPPLYIVTYFFARKMRTVTSRKRAQESEVASVVQEALTSMSVVQAFGREKHEKKRLAKQSDDSLKADLDKAKLASGFRRLVRIMVAAGVAVVIWFGAKAALSGGILPGTLLVFAAYLKELYKPVSSSSKLISDFTSALVGGERVAELVRSDVVEDAPDAVKAPPLQGAVRFEDVTFGYEKDTAVLNDISFSVEPGRLVALVGSSGTGKSSLMNLLLRFYDPWKGRILVDDTDVRRFKVKTLRRQISVVLQDPILFRRSVRENIAYGKRNSALEDVVAAAKAAHAHEFICRLPQGYDTVLAERGGDLSGGQKQRISLARAVLRDAPILILDEPATGLDAETEAELNETMEEIRRDRTTFVIAHRLSTIQRADLILVIEDGTVLEQGTHTELMAESSRYRELYRLQSTAYQLNKTA